MDGKTQVWQDYRQQYKNCLASLELANRIVTDDFIKQTGPPPEISRLRRKWNNFFNREDFLKVCRACRGSCCLDSIFSMSPLEIIYLVFRNRSLNFPQPNWKFISKRAMNSIDYPCLFLSKNGCLLEGDKPDDCIFWACKKLEGKARGLKPDIDSRITDKEKEKKEYLFWAQRIIHHFKIVGINENGMANRRINQNPGLAALKKIEEADRSKFLMVKR